MAIEPSDLELPLWTVVIQAEHLSRGLPWSSHLAFYPQTGQVFPLYTDVDLAQRYCDDKPEDGLIVVEIPNKELLYGMLKAMEIIGVHYAGIDCPRIPNARGERGWGVDFVFLREAFE